MTTHDFTLILDHRPTEDEVDALFEAGCDDASPETGPEGALLHFDREAPTLAAALSSAVRDTERAGFTVTGVRSDDAVTLGDVAERTGRSYESLRLLATGQRGPGGFPAPRTVGPYSLYSWQQVLTWLRAYDPTTGESSTYDREIAAADHLLQARHMLASDPDRATFEQLLATA